MGDKIITLSLTQREVDALYSASHFVAGQPNGMRNVFFCNNGGGFAEKLEPYTTIQGRVRDHCNGRAEFKKNY
jgi:hypothetical protein